MNFSLTASASSFAHRTATGLAVVLGLVCVPACASDSSTDPRVEESRKAAEAAAAQQRSTAEGDAAQRRSYESKGLSAAGTGPRPTAASASSASSPATSASQPRPTAKIPARPKRPAAD